MNPSAPRTLHGRPIDLLEHAGAIPDLAGPLLAWYDRGARVLPWREHPTPYRVWVSEIMLQQTRVSAALPYFNRFMEALPTIGDLADADPDTLTKLWEGLGYYSRVRNLQKAARMVVTQYDGCLPADYSALLRLPGIGEYTAGAIASIAFGIPVPAVDGNVLRVIARVLASEEDVLDPGVKKAFREVVQQMQPPARPGDFNQALMELGAMVCQPNGAPKCDQCPLEKICLARELDCASVLPVKAPKPPKRQEERTVLVIRCQQKVLLFRRPAKGLLAGLWELPNLDGHISPEAAAGWLEELGGHAPGKALSLGKGKHVFTHIVWQMEGLLLDSLPFEPPEDAVWADLDEIQEHYALPSAFRAYTKQLPELLSEEGAAIQEKLWGV